MGTSAKKVRKSPDERLVEKNRHLYKIEQTPYRTGMRDELWRKNPKGFYNFVCYLTNLEHTTIDKAILDDIKEQRKVKS